jgi:hypothetical protein
MLAVVIVIAVAGVALPVALWLTARWRKGKPARPPRLSELDAWLAREFDLGPNARRRVRKAVLARDSTAVAGAKRAPLPPELLGPARALAARVLRGQFRWLRVSRGLGWWHALLAAGYAGFGLFVLAIGWGGERPIGAAFVCLAVLYGALAILRTVSEPRRRRRHAEAFLRATDPANPPDPPGSPPDPPGSPPDPPGSPPDPPGSPPDPPGSPSASRP